MSAVIALAVKDLRILFRDKASIFFMWIFPVLYGVFFGVIFGGGGDDPKDIPVIMVDEDQSDRSRAFAEKLSNAPEFKLENLPLPEAQAKVKRGNASAYIRLAPGFGADGGMFFGEPVSIELGVDPSRRMEIGMIQGILTKYAFQQISTAFTDQGAMLDSLQRSRAALNADADITPIQRGVLSTLFNSLDTFAAGMPQLTNPPDAPPGQAGSGAPGFEPVKITLKEVTRETDRTKPRNAGGAYAVTFPQAIMWAVMGSAAGFGIGLVIERTKGTLLRLRTSPLSWSQILAGKALACFISTMISMVFLLTIGMVIFGIRPVSWPLLGVAMLCVSCCFVGIMMLLSVVGRTEASAGGIGWAVCSVMAMLGGGMVPLFVMPQWMQQLASISPVKWAILALEGPIWRGFTPAEMLLPCGILMTIGIIGFAAGSTIFRRIEPS